MHVIASQPPSGEAKGSSVGDLQTVKGFQFLLKTVEFVLGFLFKTAMKFFNGFLFKMVKYVFKSLSKDLDVLLNLCLLVGALWLSKVTLEKSSCCVQRLNNHLVQVTLKGNLVVVAALHGVEPAHSETSHTAVRVAGAGDKRRK